MTATIEKKITVRKRHEKAIAEYQKWLETNPKASRKRKIEMFNLFIDSGVLEKMVNG